MFSVNFDRLLNEEVLGFIKHWHLAEAAGIEEFVLPWQWETIQGYIKALGYEEGADYRVSQALYGCPLSDMSQGAAEDFIGVLHRRLFVLEEEGE